MFFFIFFLFFFFIFFYFFLFIFLFFIFYEACSIRAILSHFTYPSWNIFESGCFGGYFLFIMTSGGPYWRFTCFLKFLVAWSTNFWRIPWNLRFRGYEILQTTQNICDRYRKSSSLLKTSDPLLNSSNYKFSTIVLVYFRTLKVKIVGRHRFKNNWEADKKWLSCWLSRT